MLLGFIVGVFNSDNACCLQRFKKVKKKKLLTSHTTEIWPIHWHLLTSEYFRETVVSPIRYIPTFQTDLTPSTPSKQTGHISICQAFCSV